MSTDTGTHHLDTHGWLRLLVATALVLVLILTLEASPAAGALAKACRVRNADTGRGYATLQQAVDAARRGDRLTVRGICRGTTVIDKDLVIVGERTESSGKPTLSGAGKTRVVTVEARARVRMAGLIVLRGKVLVPYRATGGHTPAARVMTGNGGGILNRGHLTLANVQVIRRSAGEYGMGRGGGVHNTGTLISERRHEDPQRSWCRSVPLHAAHPRGEVGWPTGLEPVTFGATIRCSAD